MAYADALGAGEGAQPELGPGTNPLREIKYTHRPLLVEYHARPPLVLAWSILLGRGQHSDVAYAPTRDPGPATSRSHKPEAATDQNYEQKGTGGYLPTRAAQRSRTDVSRTRVPSPVPTKNVVLYWAAESSTDGKRVLVPGRVTRSRECCRPW
eukprot:3628143-Rhodomonas_salina.10